MSNQQSLDDAFIKKATDLIEANLENEQFGVNELSEALGVSRSQLHRKLNAHTGKSTSQFIREYRLEKAMELLQNNVATASEIAYRVGFSSPTYFNTRFSEYYGYPPGEVKYRNPNASDDSAGKSSEIKEPPHTRKDAKAENRKSFNRKNTIIAVFGGLLIIALLYFIFNKPEEKDIIISEVVEIPEKTLAVLPFKNLSDDAGNEYFVDGMRDDIINHLSKINGILIKSRQTSDGYGSSDLSGLEIGKALEVDYLINGSVQKHGDRIKIIVHLINTKNDTHLWSKDFNREFKDIFNLEKEISTDIATELNLVLSPDELQEIAKIPTNSIEAYNLYLKGNYFLFEFENDRYKLSEKYYKESMALDPEFALPYAGLAMYHLYKDWPTPTEEGYKKAKEYVLKALELDNSLPEPYLVLARIHIEYDMDWDAGGKAFKKAISIDPKSPDGLLGVARYLTYIKGDFSEARKLVDKVKLIAPLSYYVYTTSAEFYLAEENYNMALRDALKAKEIDYKNAWAPWIIFLAHIETGKENMAVEELAENWRLDADNNNVEPMLKAFEKEGIPGVFRWIINLDINFKDKEGTLHNAYWIAQKFAFLGEHEKAIEWLNIAYKRRSSEFYRVKYDQFFMDLRTHPDFLELLKKMNLGDYTHSSTFKK
ncbi:helix-turn-helix domain-containing protein [Algibacter sp. 2305UL17-15]|uniref:helix-turn-helix domain-containing protein n=1 Tax=Algibacter sp. 2305UL17-15 TaxID=3231268 RepID=UPI0034586187